MRRAFWLAAIVLLSLTTFGVRADPDAINPVAYAAAPDFGSIGDAQHKLLRIDLITGSTTTVGRMGYFEVEGLAFAPEGTLYGVTDTQEHTLVTIDTLTGRASAVGGRNDNLGISGQGSGQFDSFDLGLTFSCDGRLWLSSEITGQFWQVNRNTGEATLVGNLGANISGLAATANGVFGISPTTGQGFYKINLETGRAERIGGLGNISPFVDAGMDADSTGNIWAVLDYNPPPDSRPEDFNRQSDLVHIDPVTAVAAYISKTLPEVEGLAISPVANCAVPSPGVAMASPIPALSGQNLLLLIATLLLTGMVCLRKFSL